MRPLALPRLAGGRGVFSTESLHNRAVRRLALLVGVVVSVQVTATEPERAAMLDAVLQRVGERVELFFARAQSLVCLEVVRLQPLNAQWSSDGLGRTVESELRVSWDASDEGIASTEAQTLRKLLRVNGRPPRENDRNNCTTPEQQSQETQPLSLLLPSKRGEYEFTAAGDTRLDGRAAIMVDYRLLREIEVDARLIEGRDDCVSFNIEGGLRGRIWIDAQTHDVLRLDQRLSGMVEIPLPRDLKRRASLPTSWTLERWDTSIRFKSVAFDNPAETLLLPDSLSSLQVTRGAGTPRLRTITHYRNYQRFMTSGRVIGE